VAPSTASATTSSTPGVSSTTAPHTAAAFAEKLEKLCTDHDYTFDLRRIRANALSIQMTAEVFEEDTEIKKELLALGKALKACMAAHGITLKPNQFKPDWNKRTVTINAEPPILNQIIQFMIQGGAKFLPHDAKSKLGFFPPPAGTTQSTKKDDSAAAEVSCQIQ